MKKRGVRITRNEKMPSNSCRAGTKKRTSCDGTETLLVGGKRGSWHSWRKLRRWVRPRGEEGKRCGRKARICLASETRRRNSQLVRVTPVATREVHVDGKITFTRKEDPARDIDYSTSSGRKGTDLDCAEEKLGGVPRGLSALNELKSVDDSNGPQWPAEGPITVTFWKASCGSRRRSDAADRGRGPTIDRGQGCCQVPQGGDLSRRAKSTNKHPRLLATLGDVNSGGGGIIYGVLGGGGQNKRWNRKCRLNGGRKSGKSTC